MKKSTFIEYISTQNFREMFITEMGWNNYHGQADLPPITVDDIQYDFKTIAERNGFQILQCIVPVIPTASLCRRIDVKLRRSANDYIAIFVQNGTEHHQWITPVRQVEKRDIVTIEYESAEKADFLFSKIEDLSFDFDDVTTIVDVKQRVHSTFAVNSEKITKDFYAGFKKEHDAFVKFITGIDDEITDLKKNRNKQWYTSVMLNRLMFCYFIQKKGFLDGNVNYLRDKLHWCQEQQGTGHFFKSFYLQFLIHLFHDGLNAPKHNREFEQVYGKIPYLNGGMFDSHQIEIEYSDIDIADEAFERLFDFFDKWRWHLDTRISASGKDINPDVLGYIFEQYINDRAQMGAYYTKEDITEYIGRNCILPCLIDKVRNNNPELENLFSPEGYVWNLLKYSGDKYIFESTKHGYTSDWQSCIPDNIACGIDATKGHLLERRAYWNVSTPEQFGLATEIWRETIERFKRCDKILDLISTGGINSFDAFISNNLDVRTFVQDLIENATDAKFISAFYHALQTITIIDPTCGSGAFLFAAMNILEPLYEICINRMEEFNSSCPDLFSDELADIEQKFRSNIQYYIFKSIILRNLYGVDIMAEAVEIAKLRLFLKMVAVVEVDRRADNMGLDPLPDIDFNIRCGNTLYGYATENDIIAGSSHDLFTQAEFRDKVETEMSEVAHAYDDFRSIQLARHDDLSKYKAAKKLLKNKLVTFTELLNRQLFSHTGRDNYEKWLETHQPFHWVAEFYQIIHENGGFDVIIGNPPYVEYTKKNKETGLSIKDIYQLEDYSTIGCNNLYAFVIERSIRLSKNRNNIGFIVPLTIASNNNMSDVRNLICETGTVYFSHYEIRPAKLFEGVEQRLTIFIMRQTGSSQIFSTSIRRWRAEHRDILFTNISYSNAFNNRQIWRTSTEIESSIYAKLQKEQEISNKLCKTGGYPINYRTAGIRYWIIFLNNGFGTESLSNKTSYFETLDMAHYYMAALNSNLFWWYYSLNFDMFNLKDYMIFAFRLDYDKEIGLSKKAAELEQDLNEQRQVLYINSKTRGTVTSYAYRKKLSKSIIDEIDTILARHYDFTEEELDFIINYDIKYRMGDELVNEE